MKFFDKVTYFNTSLLLFACLSNIIVNTENTSAHTDICKQIRQVRLLAIEENLDGENLYILEKYYCRGRRFNRVNSKSKDCVNIANVKRLAIIAQSDRPLISNITTLERFICDIPSKNRPSYYPNGEKVQFGSSWYYPNGNQAKFGSSWYYPNGNRAKFGSSWYYPNGQIVKR